MRASRLLSILTTLQAKGHVTAQALADECEVSLRTIYRDVDALSAAGVPVYSERGSSGGYRLLDGYRVRLNGLSSTEAIALFLAGLAREASELGLGAAAANARKKMLAALPTELRSHAARTRFYLDAPTWFAASESLDQLPLIADAVWSERPIEMRYQSRKDEKTRGVEPLGLVLKGGIWYLVARADGATRTFRVSRIHEPRILEERFLYPENFDIETYWTESTRLYEIGRHPHRAKLRLSPWALEVMSEFLPPHIRTGAEISDIADAAGWRTVTLSIGKIEDAALEILRFGTHAEVLEPEALRDETKRVLSGLMNVYGII